MSYTEVIKAAEELLNVREGASLSSAQIADHLENLMRENIIKRHPRNSILSFLSRAANHDENSRIISGGPYGGYSVDPITQIVEETETGANSASESESVLEDVFAPKERHLYPLIKAWLKASEYLSADVSDLKSGGQWGNPDVMGVSHVEVLGSSEIELVSVEAKLSEKDWETNIFQAISHKRFANRSWFCYRTTAQNVVLPKNMAYYAERYKVGIIQIYLTDQSIKEMLYGQKPIESYLEFVQERIRALYEPVPLSEKKAFIERAGLELRMSMAEKE